MTQFREGDVVGYFPEEDGRQMGVEMVVLGHGEDGRPECRDLNDPTRLSGYFRPSRLRLLRRPVRVGDMVRLPDGEIRRADEQDVRLAALPYRTVPYWSNCTHADGTPIEPPKAEVKPAAITDRVDAVAYAMGQMQMVNQRWQAMLSARYLVGADLAQDRGDQMAYAVVKTQPPTVEQLARALFETDPRVIAFVDRVSDWAPPGQGHMAMRCSDDPRWSRAMRLAWERNEGHWRDDAEQRASEIRAVLLQSALPKE